MFIETDPIADIGEIEKYETNSPFYEDSNTSIISNKDAAIANETNESGGNDSSTGSFHPDNSSPPPSPKLDKSCDESSIPDIFGEDDLLDTTKGKRKRLAKVKDTSNKRLKSSCLRKRRTKNMRGSKVATGDHLQNASGESSNNNKKAIYRCEPCKKYFYEIRRYEGHIKLVHEGVKKAFECQVCGKAYKFYKNLTEHIADNHSDKPQENRFCKICNKEFKTQTTLRNHMKIIHPDPNDEDACNSRRVICDQCGFLAASAESLAAHIKNKHTEDLEQFKCEHCPKAFKCKYYLKHHVMSHHSAVKIKPFKCTDCDMAFSRRNGLNKHKLTHLDYDERMKCDFEGCNVRFLNSDAKKRHVRLVHLKEKKHVCDVCGESFGIMATLRHHRYIHTGEKPYKCNVCGQAFRQHTAMKTHAKTHFAKGLKSSKSQDLIDNTSLKSNNIELESSVNIF